MLTGIGQRPLGLEAAQITAIVRWLGENMDNGSATPHFGVPDATKSVPLAYAVTTGPRSETVALIAALWNLNCLQPSNRENLFQLLVTSSNTPSRIQRLTGDDEPGSLP